MEQTRWLSAIEQGQVLLKCENLQRTGSFKIRGAFIRLSRLTAVERSRGVVAASAGNHAQGVALAASMLDISSTVFMPEGRRSRNTTPHWVMALRCTCTVPTSPRRCRQPWSTPNAPARSSSTPSTMQT
ncbi:MAG: pyridoxal-phosphate dependent enzyme [Marmoricola sp.]